MSREVANLQEYIANLPTNVIRNIYRHPASCLAIFRLVKSKFSYEWIRMIDYSNSSSDLPVLARTIIMRFICLPNSEINGQPQPISQEVVSSWINPSHQE